jgi:Dyp-type peroxidase family
MSKLNATDIQGFVLRGYTFPFARYLFLAISAESGKNFVGRLVEQITTGERWDEGKPHTTVNVAFNYAGLVQLQLPPATLQSFPVEFVQGMKARGAILCDTGKNSPERWDNMWRKDLVHAWLGVYSQSQEGLNKRCDELIAILKETSGGSVVGWQDAGSLKINDQWSTKEHFGYTDGFGNPDYLGVERDTQPGQGKLMKDGTWAPLATGELLLGYADEAGEVPPAPVPHLLANNGTFMVYRKLHQNVATFRKYLNDKAALYGDKEKLASKFIGRWRDGTPVELSPGSANQSIVKDKTENVNFAFGKDLQGQRCPIGAHVRRVNPRDAFGFDGKLVNRRRITRRGLPYGPYAPETQNVSDTDERGVIFMVLNASIFRQFEFVQQQWIEYGNDAHQGNDKDILIGNHSAARSPSSHAAAGKFVVQGTNDPQNPPFICGGLPNFVELRGGDYFFVPSMTALRLIATGAVDPR